MVVLISGYKGNLLAMITRPSLNTPFTNAEGMVEQTPIPWAHPKEGSLFASYAKGFAPGTALRRVYDEKTTTFHTLTMKSLIKESPNTALVVDITDALSLMANDFSKHGTCNYFLTEDKILNIDSALAFQVV